MTRSVSDPESRSVDDFMVGVWDSVDSSTDESLGRYVTHQMMEFVFVPVEEPVWVSVFVSVFRSVKDLCEGP